MDVIGILRKKRQRVTGLRITVSGEQANEPPNAFERITMRYEVRGHGVTEAALQHAISLFEEKYCSVAATIRGVAAITTSFSLVEDGATLPARERVVVLTA